MKRIEEVIGRESYEKLVDAFGGMRIWVPKPGNAGHRDRKYFLSRDRRIRKLKAGGKTIRKISEMFGLSYKRVYAIVTLDGGASARGRGAKGKKRSFREKKCSALS